MTDVISTRLAPELRTQLQAEADERGVPLADVIRERVAAKPAKPTPGGRIVFSVPWNASEELRASVESWQGKQIAAIRVWYQDQAGEWKPGKRGFNCSIERLHLVNQAVTALFAAIDDK